MKLNKHIKETIKNAILINERVSTILSLELLDIERLEDIIMEVWKESTYNNEGVYHLRNEEYFILNDGSFIVYPDGGYVCISDNEYTITYEIIKQLLKFESIQPKRFEIINKLLNKRGE